MGIIKEPLEIDFEVENRPLTKEEEKLISNFIITEKNKIQVKQSATQSQSKITKKAKQKT